MTPKPARSPRAGAGWAERAGAAGAPVAGIGLGAMPLHLIHGPMNSGRTGLILNRVRDAARRDPILVAPNADAQFALESELSRDRGAVLGIKVTGPRGLAIACLLYTSPSPRDRTRS